MAQPEGGAVKHPGPFGFAMPDDFIDRARGRSERQLADLYGVCRNVITRWRREAGETINRRPPWIRSDDEYLRANYSRLSIPELAAKLNRSEGSVKRRAVTLGITTGRPRGWNLNTAERTFNSSARRLVDMRPSSQADMAADYIRSHDRTPVYRCTKEGTPNPKASYWKYGHGSVVLTEAELIAKAERKGWSADGWKRLVA